MRWLVSPSTLSRAAARLPALALAGALLALAWPASAQPSCEIPFEAYVTDLDDQPLTDALDIELRFYDSLEDSAGPLDCRFFEAVTPDAGWIRLVLDDCALTEDDLGCSRRTLVDLFREAEEGEARLYLGLRLGDETEELAPRMPLGAVPFALIASEAERVGDLEADDLVAEGELATVLNAHSQNPAAHHGDVVSLVRAAGFVTGAHTLAPTAESIAALGFATGAHTAAPTAESIAALGFSAGTHYTGEEAVADVRAAGICLPTDASGVVSVEADVSLTIHAATDSPTADADRLVVRGGSASPVDVFRVDAEGDVSAASFRGDGSALTGVPAQLEGVAPGVLTSEFTQTGLSADTPHAMADIESYTSSLTLTAVGTIRAVRASVQLSHGSLDQVDVTLTSPQGTVLVLHQNEPGTNLDVTYGVDATPSGGSMAVFVGEEASGVWLLKVRDVFDSPPLSGTLQAWSLEVDYESSGTLRVVGDLDVTGDESLAGDLGVLGALSVGDDLEVAGALRADGLATVGGNLDVGGQLLANGVPALFFGGWYCTGTVSASGSNNPLTGGQSCPAGFTAAGMFGSGGQTNCSSQCVSFSCVICYR